MARQDEGKPTAAEQALRDKSTGQSQSHGGSQTRSLSDDAIRRISEAGQRRVPDPCEPRRKVG